MNNTSKETKEFLSFTFALFNAIHESSVDGQITVQDVPNFLQVAMKAPEAVKGINFIPNEIMNLGEEESEELKTWVAEHFNISNDQAEPYFEAILLNSFALYRAGAKLYYLKNVKNG